VTTAIRAIRVLPMGHACPLNHFAHLDGPRLEALLPQFYASAQRPRRVELTYWTNKIFRVCAGVGLGAYDLWKACSAQFAGDFGGNAGELGQQDLRFVRRGVCCCSAVAGDSSRVTVALLGRFLPRLGPLPQGERPFFIYLTTSEPPRCSRSAIPRPRDRAAAPRAGSGPGGPPGFRIRPRAWRTRRHADTGARPCKARD
jgi:hypothetical protein